MQTYLRYWLTLKYYNVNLNVRLSFKLQEINFVIKQNVDFNRNIIYSTNTN